MKIYTILSESHQFLFDQFFNQSLKKYEPHAELVVVKQDQICETGNYYSSGWKESMEQKIDTYIEACNGKDKFFMWSDVDIEFHDKFIDKCIEELGDYDIAFQEGVGKEYCAGFFICRINNKTQEFFRFLKENYHNYSCDQQAINANISMIKAKFLSHKFLNISFQHRQWNGQDFTINEPLIMFHANYTVGLQHKIMLLSRVKENLENFKKKELINKKNKNKSSGVKITTAFYGLFSDVTDILHSNNREIVVSIDSLRSDPTPGYGKFLYCLNKELKPIIPPIQEGLTIRIT